MERQKRTFRRPGRYAGRNRLLLYAQAVREAIASSSKADGDPLAQGRVPLPAGSEAYGTAQASSSDPYTSASAAPAAATSAAKTPATACAANMSNAAAGAADMNCAAASAADMNCAAAGAADMRRRAAAGAADTSRRAAATTRTTTAAAGMSTTAATAAVTTTAATAAVTTARRNSQSLAKQRLVFFVEDVEGRQTDVGYFLFAENNSVRVVLRRYVRRRRGCRCPAAHRQRNAGCPQHQGCLPSLQFGTTFRLRHSCPFIRDETGRTSRASLPCGIGKCRPASAGE